MCYRQVFDFVARLVKRLETLRTGLTFCDALSRAVMELVVTERAVTERCVRCVRCVVLSSLEMNAFTARRFGHQSVLVHALTRCQKGSANRVGTPSLRSAAVRSL